MPFDTLMSAPIDSFTMLICTTCATEAPPDAQQCTQCGGRLFSSVEVTIAETMVTPPVRAGMPASDPGAPFTSGDMVAGRYRIVGLLGRGGMGEVYRADDLTLGHPVALKFLPRSVDQRADLLDRLLGEVRVTRQISHPNVCRVYDVGLANGRHFLTMEYIDGEDLASLLRRIGRLPADKALDIARQLCAGLAAAHERGVIHRDLKPANVMLDGRGKVRIADFGLAVVAHGTATPGDRAGTPAYMAPEQLAGAPLSVQSDIYALGLVLYEVFTGRPLLDARTLDELRSMQRDLERLGLTATDINLDPAVGRVIMRCVDFDPSQRPASSLAVAAALPSGDPLAAALAAGETPSPQLVAAAGDATTIAPVVAIALMVLAVAGCLISAAWAAKRSAFTLFQPPYSAEVLGVKADELLQRLRPDDPQVGRAGGFGVDSGWIVRFLSRTQPVRPAWNVLATTRPAPVYFWRRTSPRLMAPTQVPGGTRVSEGDPPRVTPGMTLVRTDLQGRLAYLDARPSARDDTSAPAATPPWPQLFREAGVDPARFASATPEWMPPSWGDARAAWTGTLAADPAIALRVEAAAYHGRPTFFVIAAPWTVKPGDITAAAAQLQGEGQRAMVIAVQVLLAAVILAAVFMARRSMKTGRGDHRGAWRLAAFVGVSQLIAALLVMAHVADLGEAVLLCIALLWPAFCAAAVWTLYLALEPSIRRAWPSALISWTRVLEGRFRDVRVARDVLAGVAATGLIDALDPLTTSILRLPPRGFDTAHWRAASDVRELLAGMVNGVDATLFLAFTLVFFFCLIRMIVRRDWIATTAFALLLGAVNGGFAFVSGNATVALVGLAVGLLVAGVTVGLLVRFGLIAVVAQILTDMLLTGVVTLSPSAWYSASSLFNLAAVILIALLAGWTCLSVKRAAAPATAGTSSAQLIGT